MTDDDKAVLFYDDAPDHVVAKLNALLAPHGLRLAREHCEGGGYLLVMVVALGPANGACLSDGVTEVMKR